MGYIIYVLRRDVMVPGDIVKVYSLTHKARKQAEAYADFPIPEPQIGLITRGNDGSPEYGDYRQVLMPSGKKVIKSVHRLELIQ